MKIEIQSQSCRHSLEEKDMSLKTDQPVGVNDLLKTMSDVEQIHRNTPKLWNPMMQSQIMQQAISPIPTLPVRPVEIGPRLLQLPSQTRDALVIRNYLDPTSATNNRSSAATSPVVAKGNCDVFPPLMVRY